MKRLFFLTLIALISSVSFAQQGSRLPDNKELVTRARSYYVESDSFLYEARSAGKLLAGPEGIQSLGLASDWKKGPGRHGGAGEAGAIFQPLQLHGD